MVVVFELVSVLLTSVPLIFVAADAVWTDVKDGDVRSTDAGAVESK